MLRRGFGFQHIDAANHLRCRFHGAKVRDIHDEALASEFFRGRANVR